MMNEGKETTEKEQIQPAEITFQGWTQDDVEIIQSDLDIRDRD